MKKPLLYFAVMLFFAACKNNTPPAPPYPEEAAVQEEKNLLDNYQDLPKVNYSSFTVTPHRISVDTAIKYMHQFIKEENLADVARYSGFGGTINVNSIYNNNPEKPATTEGFSGYFCYNKEGQNNYPEMFVAFEPYTMLRGDIDPNFPSSTDVVITSNPFLYTGDTSFTAMETFVKYQTTFPLSADDVIPTSTIKDLARFFKFKFVKTPAGGYYNYYSMAFFRNDDIVSTLKEFYDQFGTDYPVQYVRYYFGYEPDQNKNKVRLILAPVDQYGHNIIEYNNVQAFFLERTYP